jgi:cytochrome P450
MLDFVNRIFLPPPHVDLPGFAFHRFANAKRELDRQIYEEIARRRAAPDEGDDVMALLLETRDEAGDALSDVEVRDQVVSLIIAGFETTSSAVTWALYAMLKDRRIWEAARSESQRVLGDAPLQIDHLAKLAYIDRVTSEALRLYPSVFIGVRKVVEPVELFGHRIPSGRLVAYSPYVTHRIESIWPDPERFDPDRWDEARPGHREPTPYEYVPFGGGARRCIGQSFAILDLKVMLAELARRTELALPPQRITPTGFSAMFPKEGIQVRVDSVRSFS